MFLSVSLHAPHTPMQIPRTVCVLMNSSINEMMGVKETLN